MNISEHSVKKPITVLMGILMIVMLGIFSYSKLSLELLPDMNLPYAAVVTTYPGANPYEVEEEVSKPIESALQGVGNFKTITSTSSENFSVVMIEFAQSTDMNTAFLEMRERLDTLDLMDGVGDPSIMKFDPSMMPIMVVSVSRDFNTTDDQELILTSEWVESELMSQFESIDGVANVEINGASDTVIQLTFDQEILNNYNLSEQGVLQTIEAQNISGMIGIVPDGNQIRFMYLGNDIEGIDQLENTPITYVDDEVIYVKDLVLDITFINQSANSYNKVNGQDAVSVVFFQQSDTEIVDVVHNITNRLDTVIRDADVDADYQILMNQGEYIELAVGSVVNNLLLGALAAIVVLFLFLRDVRPTIIVALSIPISIIGAFLLMFFTGVSLNIISMGGLALGIGMLVDNSIVVIENTFRLLKEGKSRQEAAIAGAKQVGMAITASTLTTIMVFIPVFFIDNLIVEIFRSMALTVMYSLFASLVIALTMVPSLSSKVLKEHEYHASESWVAKFYTKTLDIALKHKALLMILILAILGGSVYFSLQKGFEMMPVSDEGQVNITIEMDKDVTFDMTTDVADYVVSLIDSIDGVETISASVGGSTMGFLGGSQDTATITILLSDTTKRTSFDVAEQMQMIVDDIDYKLLESVSKEDVLHITSSASSSASAGGGFLFSNGVSIEIAGDDLYQMETVANDLVQLLEGIDGVLDPTNGISRGDDVVRIEVNKDTAIQYGLTEQDIQTSIDLFYNALGFSLMNNTNTQLMIPVNGVQYDLTLPAQEFDMSEITAGEFLKMIKVFDTNTVSLIEKALEDGITLYMPNVAYFDAEETILNPNYNPEIPSGTLVVNPNLRVGATEIYTVSMQQIMAGEDTDPHLADLGPRSVFDESEDPITTIDEHATGFSSIERNGKSRVLTVSASIGSGYNTQLVNDEVQIALDEYLNANTFHNISVTLDQNLMETVQEVVIAVLVAVLLVYMVMAIQFQSLVYPFIVLFTVPLAFTGAFLALIIMDMPIDLPGMVGLIILTGIIVNNGIVLIDYINQRRRAGAPVHEAIKEAGVVRLRPIFMTAFTTSIALLPMAIGLGEGSEMLQPLAITSMGGLLYATVLTLYVVPSMYEVMAHD